MDHSWASVRSGCCGVDKMRVYSLNVYLSTQHTITEALRYRHLILWLANSHYPCTDPDLGG